jgi:hypothetical protein
VIPRTLLVFTVVVVGALLGSAPTRAIETATFGLDVAERSADARLHIDVAAGKETAGRILLWNKQATPMRLRLSVSPATVDAAGKAALGGDDSAAVGWIHFADEEVELRAEERREVEVTVRAPRKLEGRTRTVAIIAEPVSAAGDEPAVLERLALTTYLEPDEDSLIASLGAFPWIALGVLLVVATAAVRIAARRRREEPGLHL